MSHSLHSYCHATHNADGGPLEDARLIQVLPAEVRERLKEPCTKKNTSSFHGPLWRSNFPWRSNVSGEGRRQLCRQQNWQCRAAFSLCSQGLSASFGRLSRIPPQSTQSHAEKKHTGMHVSLHGLLFHWLKISEWFSIFYNRHHVAPAFNVHAIQPLWHVHRQFLCLMYGTCAAF